jgi:hypothetical protein
MKALLIGTLVAVSTVACGAGNGTGQIASANASAKPLSTCAKDLAEDKPPEKPPIPKATHEITKLLPAPKPPSGSSSTVRLGAVETAPDYSAVQPAPLPIVDVSWRHVPVEIPRSPAPSLGDWKKLQETVKRFYELSKQKGKAKSARVECGTERCRSCFDDLVDESSAELSRAREEILALADRLLVDLRKSSATDADAQLLWGEVLSLKASFLDSNDHEATILKKEALATFFHGASLPSALPEIAAWLRYSAMREAAELEDDAVIPGVTARGKTLQLDLGKALLTGGASATLKAEVAYRVASLGAGMGKPTPSSLLRDAIMADPNPKEESAKSVSLVARTFWARAAIDEGDALGAVRALAPVYQSRDIVDLVAESNALLAEALKDLGRYEGPSLGLVDEDTFADIALGLATTASQYHDVDLVHQALVAIWKEAPNTLRLPQALRSLTYSAAPSGEQVEAGKQLDALMKLDPSGHLMSPWAEAMRTHVPPFTDDVIRTNMLATGVYPPAPDPSREAEARWRSQDLAQKCHAGSMDGPTLEIEIDANGRFTIKATGDDPGADWTSASGEQSLRACLTRVGPVIFRTFGSPVSLKLVPYQHGSSYGNTRY